MKDAASDNPPRITVERYAGAKASRPFAVKIDGLPVWSTSGRVRTFTTEEAARRAGERELGRRSSHVWR